MEHQEHVNCRNCQNASRCFQFLYDQELDFVDNQKTQVSFMKGETVFKQGAFAPHLLYVIDGLVLIYLQSGRGKCLNVCLVKPGDFLTLSPVFDRDVYQCSARALTNASVCMIDKKAVQDLLKNNAEFASGIMARNQKHDDRFLEILSSISFKQMRGKLASALLYLSSEEFEGVNVFYALSRRDIARFASITLESAVKFIKEFEKEGLIEVQGRHIRVLDRQKLQEINDKG